MKKITIILLLIIPILLIFFKFRDDYNKIIENKKKQILLLEKFRTLEKLRTEKSDPCYAVKNYIKNNLDKEGICVFDYDNTITDRNGDIAKCTASAVSACPSLAINTYNSGATYDTCCTNPIFIKAGFCVDGKCKVPKKYWANRVGYNHHYLNNKYVGDVFVKGTKTLAMDMMNLDKQKTMLIDDLPDNISHAKMNGYKTLYVYGGNGLN